MQLSLILGVAFAIVAVVFALQNSALVVVTLAFWNFEGSLAIVLLLAVGLGVLITALLTTPAMIRGQWTAKRLRREVARLEREIAEDPRHPPAAPTKCESSAPTSPTPEKPYVGLRSLLSGEPPTNT